MGLGIKQPSGDHVRRVLLAALTTALEDAEPEERRRSRLTGVRVLAAGAALYTAGWALYSQRDAIHERLEALAGDEEDDEEEPPKPKRPASNGRRTTTSRS